MLVEDKTTVITGAGSGIGRTTALRFAHHGANVVVADIDQDGLDETVDSIRSDGGNAIAVPTDVADPAEVKQLISTTVAEFGGLDVLVNNAGVEGPLSEFKDYSVEDFEQVTAVNLKGVFLGMKYGIEAMVADGGGSIVNTSSVAARIGAPGRGGYAGSKAGINGMMRVAAVEYASDGIRVNSVLPGIVQTPMHDRSTEQHYSKGYEAEISAPMPGSSEPEDIANIALFLGSDLAERVTGVCIPVDGGLLAMP